MQTNELFFYIFFISRKSWASQQIHVCIHQFIFNLTYEQLLYIHKKCKGGSIQELFCHTHPCESHSIQLFYYDCSENPIIIEGFSSNLAAVFTSTRQYVVPMSPLCQLKVTLKMSLNNGH